MNIRLHIDRLVLRDVSLAPAERRLLQPEIQAELARLVQGRPDEPRRVQARPGSELGRAIARSIHAAMTPAHAAIQKGEKLP